MHINTQSMVSTFDGVLFAMQLYNFDAVCMSETCLKNNNLLLHHVSSILKYLTTEAIEEEVA